MKTTYKINEKEIIPNSYLYKLYHDELNEQRNLHEEKQNRLCNFKYEYRSCDTTFSSAYGFISRTIFLNILGVTYLGLNNYLSSLVSILSLAELGIGGAMTYALYGPLAREEHAKINAFMILFKKLYRMIGIGIFIIGSILALFLPYIIKDYPVNREVYIIYFLFVF